MAMFFTLILLYTLCFFKFVPFHPTTVSPFYLCGSNLDPDPIWIRIHNTATCPEWLTANISLCGGVPL